jgi:hypothetical protein
MKLIKIAGDTPARRTLELTLFIRKRDILLHFVERNNTFVITKEIAVDETINSGTFLDMTTNMTSPKMGHYKNS